MNRQFSLYLFVGLALFLSACQSDADDTPPPNFVFLFADDLTYSALGAYGNKVIQTPHLDKLAADGVQFANAYNMGGWNGAICMASRAMIISGRSVWRAHDFQTNWNAQDTVHIQQTWGRLLADAGYRTYMTGKWHVAAPANRVFDTARHIRPGMPADNRNAYWKYMDLKNAGQPISESLRTAIAGYNRPLNESDDSWSPSDTTLGGFWEGGKHWSEVVRDDALDFIADAKDRPEPFFMYLAFNAPHDPRQAPQSFINQYPLESIEVPASFLPEYPYKDSIGCAPRLRDEGLAPFPRTEFAVRKHIQEYYAIISHLDEQIGKIIAALAASGQLENTYLVFSADHGLSVGRHGLLGKQNMYDHSMKVPLLISGPSIPAGSKVQKPVYLQDVMATSLELAGLAPPDYLEFKSLLPLATGTSDAAPYDYIYGAYQSDQRMLRQDGYKLIAYPRVNKFRLFDLREDPQELNDLAQLPEQQERLADLYATLLESQRAFGDTLRLDKMRNALEGATSD